MRNTVCVLLLLVNIGLSQEKLLRVSHALTASSGIARSIRTFTAPDTLRILVALVEFAEDNDSRTSGNGKFQLAPLSGLLDPPPHNSAYFSRKIQFVKNYFSKVSNGKLQIEGTILSSVVQLNKQMSAYSPTANDNTNKPLANLASDTWKTVDTLAIFQGLDFSRYDAFMIFHAGIGRDIDIVGILGFDGTPFDLPSLTFTPDGFAKVGFTSGISVRNGTFTIDNTIILPESETRILGSTGSSSDTLKLSMNGLTAASIGSYLGLPDLFNTETGRPGIGQFGLMDGASIFAYSGIFPPEPSAWEKVALGWVQPIVISSNATNLVVPAVGIPSDPGSQDTIYKIPISSSEYFLVENRNRDANRPRNGNGDGQQITTRNENGSEGIFTVPYDSIGFLTYADVRGITGSVVDVEDFDWALIGLSTSSDKTYEGGGILIWHIDEGIISAKRESNSVNADPSHRGVELEEADGALDIGQSYGVSDNGFGSESGSPLDCWYAENTAQLYVNRFDQYSYPNSNSHKGASSLVKIKDFSKRGLRMTFSVEFGSNTIKSVVGFPKSLTLKATNLLPVDLDNDGTVELLHNSISSSTSGQPSFLYAYRQNGNPFMTGGFSSGKVARADTSSISTFVCYKASGSSLVSIAGYSDPWVFLWNAVDQNGDSLFDVRAKFYAKSATVAFVDSFLIFKSNDTLQCASLQGGILWRKKLTSTTRLLYCQIPSSGFFSFADDDSLFLAFLSSGAIQSSAKMPSKITRLVSGDVLGDGKNQVVALCSDNTVDVVVPATVVAWQNPVSTFVPSPYVAAASFDAIRDLLLVDVNNDGKKEILLLTKDGSVVAFNYRGILIDGYPKRISSVDSVAQGLLSASVSGDGNVNLNVLESGGIMSVAQAGSQSLPVRYQLPTSGVESGVFFPYRNSSNQPATAFAWLSSETNQLSVVEFSSLYTTSNVRWPMHGFDFSNSWNASGTIADPRPLAPDFFPKERVYNYPNPVYGSSTMIRYYVSQNANVTVTIFDLAGSKITELQGTGVAGLDNEIRWDVSRIQSGIYLATIEANSAASSGSAVVKIAVVK